ncbi:MAG: hypothetical protein HYV07_16520 [Deltaproteobacteria bacterium]|nr:hypothetical protein [Deltaproteobacteria bacterium]
MIRQLTVGLAFALAACEPLESLRPGPRVMPSADTAARHQIFVNRVRDGVYRSIQPRCLDTVRVGQTVEFLNMSPEVPANVTSIAGPTLYSPNLVRPYNYVGPEDPANPFCDSDGPEGCVARPAYSYWRATLIVPGVYDWIDTNQGAPGRKVVDAYYGTETFVGIDPNTPVGTICVSNTDGSDCEGVCCSTDSDCGGGKVCNKGPSDARGRCQTPSG